MVIQEIDGHQSSEVDPNKQQTEFSFELKFTEMDVVTTLDHLFDQVFASKPKEKRAAWLKILNAEEYETVEDLRLASDEAWASLQLPLAIKDSLKNALKAPSKPPVPQPLIKSKPVDTRPIAQLDVIVFDISSSMNSKSFDPLNTRLGLAKTLFHSMVLFFFSFVFLLSFRFRLINTLAMN